MDKSSNYRKGWSGEDDDSSPYSQKWGLVTVSDSISADKMDITYYNSDVSDTHTDLVPQSLTYNGGKTAIAFDVDQAHGSPTLTDVRISQ
jgi:hypothetical protein